MSAKIQPGVLVLTHKATGYFLICPTRNTVSRLAMHMEALRWRMHSNRKFMRGFTRLEDVVVQRHLTSSLQEARLKAAELLTAARRDRLCCNIIFDGWAGQLPTSLDKYLCSANPGRKIGPLPKPVVEQKLELRRKRNPPASFARHCTVISINGVEYSSISQAVRVLHIERKVITQRLASQEEAYADWFIVKQISNTL